MTGALRTSTRCAPDAGWPTCIDDLSNWYVRTSRRRFWDGDPAALSTLHECLRVLTLLMAPFTPFVTDEVWNALFAPVRTTPCTWRTGLPTTRAVDERSSPRWHSYVGSSTSVGQPGPNPRPRPASRWAGPW